MRPNLLTFLAVTGIFVAPAARAFSADVDPELAKFSAAPAPKPAGLMLNAGDRLAICGDSITEQRMYSRMIEDYLTMCVPQLQVTVRQYGWSGEKAPGFLARMTNDCLRFKPTIATTCYGMNDHEYQPYEDRIGNTYREKSTAIVEAFKANGVRVVQGSPGCVGKMPSWVKTATGTVEDLNLNLCKLRNIGIEIAEAEHVGFADVFWPMMNAGVAGQHRYGTNYAIAGTDGVHPGWAGQTVMAYAFLKAFGVSGEIGTLTVDLRANTMRGSPGHEILSGKEGDFEIQSSRYPFCLCVPAKQEQASYPVCSSEDIARDNTIRSATALIPFNQDLNRFMLVARNAKAKKYKVVWDKKIRSFTTEQLVRGINLAEEFPENPFSEAFSKVDAAVAVKQAYETKQIKQLFRSPEARQDMEGVAAKSERDREPWAEAIKTAFVPVKYTLSVVSE